MPACVLHALPQHSHCLAVLPVQEVNEAFDELEEGNEEALKTEYDRQVGGGVLAWLIAEPWCRTKAAWCGLLAPSTMLAVRLSCC